MNQGRKKPQIDFSHKMVSIGYYGIIVSIILFLIRELL